MSFRLDPFYRLNGVPVTLPPRREEIPALVERRMARFAQRYGALRVINESLWVELMRSPGRESNRTSSHRRFERNHYQYSVAGPLIIEWPPTAPNTAIRLINELDILQWAGCAAVMADNFAAYLRLRSGRPAIDY